MLKYHISIQVTMIKYQFLFVLGVTVILTLGNLFGIIQGIYAQTNCPQLTSDPFTNQLLCRANQVGGQMDPRNPSENVKDNTWTPPSTNEELNNICSDQAENTPNIGDVDSHCQVLLDNCNKLNLNVEECYVLNFIQLGVNVPSDVSNSLQAKLDAAN